MKAGLPSVVMPQAASTGSAGEPGCIRKKLASRKRRDLSEGSMATLAQTGGDDPRPKEVRRATVELVAT
jgi:hypothetical protein